MQNRFVDKLSTFNALVADDVSALTRATAASRQYGGKVDLIREGDRPGPVLVILEGWACRYKILPSGTRQILGFLMPGDSCDLHVALLAEMDHSIQTITPALVAKIDRDEMDRMLEAHSRVAKAMYISQLVDEGTMRAWITSMGRRTSLERVAHLICELYIRASNVGITVSPQFSMPLSQLMLADALGMTPVHLNRVLKELRARGAMTVTRGNVVIAEPQLLIQIAGFDENYLHRRSRPAA
jgi:CRP-like cAMP-binding protein